MPYCSSQVFHLPPPPSPLSLPPSLPLWNHCDTQVIEGEAVTGLEMHQRISAAVQQLRTRGVAPGNRLLITMSPSVDFFALAIAAFIIGKCIYICPRQLKLDDCNHV